MSKKVEIELNQSGIISLFKSSEVHAALQEAGNAVANYAGPDYAASTHNAGFTAIANVFPNSAEAARENYQENALLKAAGSLGLPSSKPHL